MHRHTLEARTGLPSQNNGDCADTKHTACLILTGLMYLFAFILVASCIF